MYERNLKGVTTERYIPVNSHGTLETIINSGTLKNM